MGKVTLAWRSLGVWGNFRSRGLFVQNRMGVFPFPEVLRTTDFCKLSVLLQAILKSCRLFPGTIEAHLLEGVLLD